jgi:hypothetical protein
MSHCILICQEPVLAAHVPSQTSAGSHCQAKDYSAPHCGTDFFHEYELYSSTWNLKLGSAPLHRPVQDLFFGDHNRGCIWTLELCFSILCGGHQEALKDVTLIPLYPTTDFQNLFQDPVFTFSEVILGWL